MKIILKIQTVFLLAFLTGSLLFTSCNKESDNYSIGDFMVSFGVVVKSSAETEINYIIHLDNGDKLVSLVTPPHWLELHNGQRVQVIFAPFDDKINADNTKTYYGKINDIHDILFKNILKLTPAIDDSIGHDPITLRESWISGDSILTIGFNYYTAGSVHYINLADNGEGNGISQPYIFEFRHNARGDLQRYRATGLVSFDLNPIKVTGQHKVDFIVRYSDYTGKTTDLPHTFIY